MSTPQQPSKKDRREAARAARLEAEQAAASSQQRKKRLTILLGAIAAVAIIAIVLIATTSSNKDDSAGVKTGDVKGVPQMTAMLKGIPESGITLGNPKAKVKVVEFIDPQCPVCKAFANDVFPTLVQDYVRPGKVLYETRTLDFLDNNFGGTDSNRGARYLNAAGFQNKMANMQALLYSNQGEEGSGFLTDDFLVNLGKKIPGFNPEKALADSKTEKAAALIAEANTLFSKYGGTGTPTILVGPANGTLAQIQTSNVTDAKQYKDGIDAALANAGVK